MLKTTFNFIKYIGCYEASPVALSVERCTPCGESARSGYKTPGFEARRALDVCEPPGGYGCG